MSNTTKIKIDEYTLYKKLGEGAFGEVYLTKKENSKELFATKLIDKSIVTISNSINYLKNELKILKALDHPNIIRLYKSKESKSHFFFIFEYCNYGTLSTFINKYMKLNKNKGGLPEHICRKVFKEIVEAVFYLHSNNIIHRDLKPDNIILNYTGMMTENESSMDMDVSISIENLHIKIIDFGFARFTYDNELLTSTLGSALHMDPRILKKMKKIENFQYNGYNKDADIWSLGCVLYEMVVGQTPFNSFSYDDLFKKLDEGKYYIPVSLNLSYSIMSLINGMLRSDVKSRLSIGEIMKHEFIIKENEEGGKRSLYRKKNMTNSNEKLIFDIYKNDDDDDNDDDDLLNKEFNKMNIDNINKDYSSNYEINKCIDVLEKEIGHINYSFNDTLSNVFFDINKKFTYPGFIWYGTSLD